MFFRPKPVEAKRFTLTTAQIAAAFTEWMRRFQENPDKFLSDQATMTQDSSTYGTECAPYFLSILAEQGQTS
jgi:transposase-like protein